MNTDNTTLWRQLQQAKLVTGAHAPEQTAAATPWYMRAMLAFMGWIGALLILAVLFTGLSGMLESNTGRLGIAIILGFIALLLFRGRENQDFRMQFALALSLAAQILVFWSLSSMLLPQQPVVAALVVMMLALVLLAGIPNSIHRLWSAGIASLALLYLMGQFGMAPVAGAILGGAACWLWQKEFVLVRWGSILRPLAWAITLTALVQLSGEGLHSLLQLLFSRQSSMQPELLVLRGAITLGIIILVTHTMLKEAGIKTFRLSGLAAMAVLFLLAFFIPGIGFSLLLALVAFSRGNHLLAGMAVASLLLFLSKYYYLLDISLLHKSLLLAVSGLLLLALRLLIMHLSASGAAK